MPKACAQKRRRKDDWDFDMDSTTERRVVLDTRLGLQGPQSVVFQILAVLLGAGLWRPLRAWLLSLTHLGAFLARWETAAAVLESPWTSAGCLLVALLVAAGLGKRYGSTPATSFIFAVVASPLYLALVLVRWSVVGAVRLFGRSFSLVSGFGRLAETLVRRPAGLFYLLCAGAAVSWAVLALQSIPGLVMALSIGVLPLIACLTVVWLYFWTFDPLAALQGVKTVWVRSLAAAAEVQKRQIQAALAANDEEALAREHEAARKAFAWFRRAADRITEPNVVAPATVHLFVALLILVAGGIAVLFAVSYRGLHAIQPEQMVVTPGHESFLEFLHFSLRTLVFSDDRFVYTAGPLTRLVSFIELVCGMGLFTILILTFSTVSLRQAASAREALRQDFERTLDTWKKDPVLSSVLNLSEVPKNGEPARSQHETPGCEGRNRGAAKVPGGLSRSPVPPSRETGNDTGKAQGVSRFSI